MTGIELLVLGLMALFLYPFVYILLHTLATVGHLRRYRKYQNVGEKQESNSKNKMRTCDLMSKHYDKARKLYDRGHCYTLCSFKTLVERYGK